MSRRSRVLVLLAVGGVLLGAGACSSSEPESSPSPAPSVEVVVDNCPPTEPPTSGGTTSELPALTLPCLGHGGDVHLAGLTGRPAVVNIWASWCLPCQREVPALQSLYDAARPDLRVLGVDIEDTDASALDFARAVGMHYPSVIDRNGDVLRRLGFAGPPVTLFLDADGEIVHRAIGEQSAKDLRGLLDEHLGIRV